MKFLLPLALAALLAACAPDPSSVKAIVGGTLVDPAGNTAIEHAVIVIDGTTVRTVGTQAAVPIPAGSLKVSGAGKTIAPQPGSGAIEAGRPANLVLMSGGRVERSMVNGEWVEAR